MTDKALVRPSRGAAAIDLDAVADTAAVEIQHVTPGGVIVAGTRDTLDALAASGARVKLLPDTNLIRIYDQVIDIEAGNVLEGVPTRGRVPRDVRAVWTHHLVQLDGPPNPEWIAAIEAHGVEVIEPVGAYALLVVGDAKQMTEVGALDFVAWLGPFQPAVADRPGIARRTRDGTGPHRRLSGEPRRRSPLGGRARRGLDRGRTAGRPRTGATRPRRQDRHHPGHRRSRRRPQRARPAACGFASSSSTSRCSSMTSVRRRSSPSR